MTDWKPTMLTASAPSGEMMTWINPSAIDQLKREVDALGTKLAYHAQNEFTTENIKIRETCPAEREDVPWLVHNAAAFQAEFARSKNKILQEQNDTLRARCERLAAVARAAQAYDQWDGTAQAFKRALDALHPSDTEEAK